MATVKASEHFKLSPFELKLISSIKNTFNDLNIKQERMYIVGGFVRDKLLGNPIRDYDILCWQNIFPKVENYLYKNAKKLGIKNCNSHQLSAKNCKGDSIFRFTLNGTEIEIKSYNCKLKEDTKKRDFTINAVYYDIFTEMLVDYCSGILDIFKKILRTVNDFNKTFYDSFERFIRLARFNVKDFTIEESLYNDVNKFFNAKKYRSLKINWKSVSLQLDRFFESKDTRYLFNNLRQLSILGSLHKPLPNASHTKMIYDQCLIILEKLEIVLNNPEFKHYIHNYFANVNYNNACINLKKAAVAYVFTRIPNSSSFISIDELDFKFNIKYKEEIFFGLLLKEVQTRKLGVVCNFYMNQPANYPFLSLIFIIEAWTVKELRRKETILKIIDVDNIGSKMGNYEEETIIYPNGKSITRQQMTKRLI